MKNKKLSLNELKVKSFVTEFENDEIGTVKGGFGYTLPVCTLNTNITKLVAPGEGCVADPSGICTDNGACKD